MGTDEIRKLLMESIKEKSLKIAAPGEVFTLASGKESNYYLNLKPIVLSAIGNWQVCRLIMDKLHEKDIICTAIGGPALGAIPIVGGLSTMFATVGSIAKTMGIETDKVEDISLPEFFYVRKQEKDHGTKQLVEGPVREGMKAVIVEDVTTTGESAAKAVVEARKAGLIVNHVICVVDRQDGGEALLKNMDIQLHPIFTKGDFGL